MFVCFAKISSVINWIITSLPRQVYPLLLKHSVVDLIKNLGSLLNAFTAKAYYTRGHIFSHVRPFNERAVSNIDRPMHRSLWV